LLITISQSQEPESFFIQSVQFFFNVCLAGSVNSSTSRFSTVGSVYCADFLFCVHYMCEVKSPFRDILENLTLGQKCEMAPLGSRDDTWTL